MTSENCNKCPICHDPLPVAEFLPDVSTDLSDNISLYRLSCGHVAHARCLMPLSQCPTCRTNIERAPASVSQMVMRTPSSNDNTNILFKQMDSVCEKIHYKCDNSHDMNRLNSECWCLGICGNLSCSDCDYNYINRRWYGIPPFCGIISSYGIGIREQQNVTDWCMYPLCGFATENNKCLYCCCVPFLIQCRRDNIISPCYYGDC